jgi:cytoskeletal protein RodZ
MNDFGGKLRQARERRGVSLRQIATSTKISVAALEALERNDISRLPGGIFSRAFVRSYAIEVGLDPDETVREFLERFRGEPPPPAAATPAHVTEEESAFESQQQMASVLLKLVIISLPLIGVILYFTLRQRAVTEIQRPTSAPGVQDQAATRPPIVTEPATPVPDPRPTTGLPSASDPTRPMRLELHPTGPCWITLKIDGRDVFSRVMQPGEREAYDVRESAEIVVGDAGAFAFSINGRAGRPLGGTGQVRTARITRETLAEYIR